VAVSGVNVVMREGVSYRHPSRFLLVGTMNPEEGELRPQLLDRFGLCVEISGERDVVLRKSIVERVLLFEGEDAGFREKWDRKDEEMRIVVRAARAGLGQVYIADHLLKMVTEVNVTLGIAGHRGDLAILKTARALAALRGGAELSPADLRDAIRLALPHRVPRTGVNAARAHHVERLLSWAFPGKMEEDEEKGPLVPLPGTAHGMKRGGVIFRATTLSPEEQERQAISQAMAARHRYEAAEAAAEAAARAAGPPVCGDPECDYCQGYAEESVITPSEPYEVRKIIAPKGRKLSDAAGKRSTSRRKVPAAGTSAAVRGKRGGTSRSTRRSSPPPRRGMFTPAPGACGSPPPTFAGNSGSGRSATSSSS